MRMLAYIGEGGSKFLKILHTYYVDDPLKSGAHNEQVQLVIPSWNMYTLSKNLGIIAKTNSQDMRRCFLIRLCFGKIYRIMLILQDSTAKASE